MANGFDCATKLNSTTATALRSAGFEYVARYLGNSWKTFDIVEATIIKNAGLKLISIFEKNSTRSSYFSKSQGISDAQEAYKYAKAVGQPVGSAIYFTVDYDAKPTDMPRIIDYLNGVKQCLVDYKIGLYGSYAVMQAVKGVVDYYWQTYAWSKGKVADFIHMHQYQNGVTVSGVQLDRDEIKSEPGAWGNQSIVKNNGIIQRVKALVRGDIRKGPSHSAEYLRDHLPGEEFDVYKRQGDWHCVGGTNGEEYWIDGNGGANLYWIDNPNNKQQHTVAPQVVNHEVQPGDTVSKLAKQYGSTLAQIKTWNSLDKNYTIFAGKKIRVK